jgi:hypothetical protein
MDASLGGEKQVEAPPHVAAVAVLDRGAVASLLLGLLSLACGFTAPFAMWIGYRALASIDRSDGRLTGRPAALWGLGLGIASLTLSVIGLAYWWLAS